MNKNPRVGELAYVIVDCNDNELIADFWGKVLGLEIARHTPPYIDLEPIYPAGPTLSFQKVTEPATTKNRLHMDIKVAELDTASARIIELGGQLVKECVEGPYEWQVMTDPEGNVFCLVTG